MKDRRFGYTSEQYAVFRKYAWRYLLLFSFLYCCHYCTRLNLSNASALMLEGLNWSASDIGILTSTLFWTYGLGQLINGRLGDVVGPTRLVCAGVLLSALANIFFGLQSSLLVMAVTWGLNGFFQSMAWTPGIAALTKWWPGERRGFATGFANAFSGFGQAVATLAVALSFTMFPDMGWRAAFILPAAFPLLMLVVFKIFAKPSPKSIGLEEYVEEDESKVAAEREMLEIVRTRGKLYPYRYLLKNPVFLVWMFVIFSSGLVRYGLVTWIPLYFVDAHGTDITAGLLQSLTLPIGMGIGTLVVPWLTDRLCPGNRAPAVVVSSLVAGAAIACFYFLEPDTALALVLIEIVLFVAGFFVYAINGTVWAFATDVGGRVFSGTASGMLNCCAYAGAAVQAAVYGFLVDNGGWNVMFVSLTCLCVVIAVAMFMMRNRAVVDQK